MTREKALEVTNTLIKIETYEALIEDIHKLNGLDALAEAYGECDVEDELVAVVQVRLDKLLKELEEM